MGYEDEFPTSRLLCRDVIRWPFGLVVFAARLTGTSLTARVSPKTARTHMRI
jgi:hypothetical protein